MRMTDTALDSTQNQSLTQKREQARLLYAQGLGVTQIARHLDEKRATVASWKKRDGWVRADIFTDVNLAMKARLLSLIGMDKKGNGEYKEIDELMRQLERIAKIQNYNDSGNGGDLNPKLRERYKSDRKEKVKNLFTEEEIVALEDAYKIMLYPFQQEWIDILDGKKVNGKKKYAPARIFMMLKSRQIGATYVIAIWALINALRTKKNKIFLSASKAQAYQFIEYIKNFIFEVLGRQIGGDPIVISFEDNTQVNFYYMGTNALTAQGRHGDVIIDEFFWIRKFKEFRDVASGMASQSQYQQIYLSTPSSVMHEAYKFWTGADGVNKHEIDVSHATLKTPTLCMDGKWRLMVTVRDAMRGGYDKLDIDQLQLEYTPDRFDNLFMCVFLDDSSSYFPLSILSPNMIDSWEVWKDFKPLGSNPIKNRFGLDMTHHLLVIILLWPLSHHQVDRVNLIVFLSVSTLTTCHRSCKRNISKKSVIGTKLNIWALIPQGRVLQSPNTSRRSILPIPRLTIALKSKPVWRCVPKNCLSVASCISTLAILILSKPLLPSKNKSPTVGGV